MAIPDGKPATDFSAMNREWVRAVAEEAASGGGSGLPEITAQDEGKVLTVDTGEAVWDSLPASPISYVSVTWEEDTGTMSKTWQEIYNDLSSGKIVYNIDTSETSVSTYIISSCIINADSYDVFMTNITSNPPEVYLYSTDSANGYPSITD